MAGVLPSGSTGVMSTVIGKLATLMGEEYKKHKRMQREVAFLKDELGSMNAVLINLTNMEELDPQTTEWRNQVMDMAFDIEDCIDDFMHRVEGANVASVGFVRKTARRLKAVRARHQIANQIQELKARVKDVSERHLRYNLDECASSSSYVSVDPRMPALYMEAANLVGMDGPKDELMKLLEPEDEGASMQCLRVVSILGFGGLGKTTLAKKVYDGIGGQYACQVFVSVSQRPNLMKLLSRMVSKVGMPHGTHIYEVQDLVDKLRDYLKDKRYLFVIDDIWDESVWKYLRCAFPDNQRGSKVITTTRIEGVAKLCCNYHDEYIYRMKQLDDQNSKKLFFGRVGHVCPQPFKAVSDEILRKCGGLPLAILSIASLLASQPNGSIEQWEYVCSSLSSNLRTHPSLEGMRHVLNLSYNHLPHHLKPCLLYFGMYPEDYSIAKEDLVRQWVAEGFVSKTQDRDAEEVAGSYFHELTNRSMIQPSEVDYNGEILECKVHDMILDLILFKSEEDNFLRAVDNQHRLNKALQCKVRRLSLHLEGANQNTTQGRSLSHLRSLAILGYPSAWLPVSEFKTIRVLHRECSFVCDGYIIDLTQVCKLVQLRYLKIPSHMIEKMPTRMGCLQCLETLDLGSLDLFTTINSIPSDIVHLPHLLHLIVPSIIRLPDGIGNMKSLRTLRCFNVFLNTLDNLKSLSELTNVRDLELSGQRVFGIGSQHEQRNTDIVWSSIVKLFNCNLRCLQVKNFSGKPTPVHLSSSLTISHTQSHLDRLEASGWPFHRFPSWICQFRKLYRLRLTVKKLLKDGVDVLAALPALAFLWLWIRKAPEERIIVSGSTAEFPALKYFRLWCSALCLAFEAGAMAKLQTLVFELNARGMQRYGPAVLDGVMHLVSLKTVNSYIFYEEDLGSYSTPADAEATLRNAINLHPGHPSVSISLYDIRRHPPDIRDLVADDSDRDEAVEEEENDAE